MPEITGKPPFSEVFTDRAGESLALELLLKIDVNDRQPFKEEAVKLIYETLNIKFVETIKKILK